MHRDIHNIDIRGRNLVPSRSPSVNKKSCMQFANLVDELEKGSACSPLKLFAQKRTVAETLNLGWERVSFLIIYLVTRASNAVHQKYLLWNTEAEPAITKTFALWAGVMQDNYSTE